MKLKSFFIVFASLFLMFIFINPVHAQVTNGNFDSGWPMGWFSEIEGNNGQNIWSYNPTGGVDGPRSMRVQTAGDNNAAHWGYVRGCQNTDVTDWGNLTFWVKMDGKDASHAGGHAKVIVGSSTLTLNKNGSFEYYTMPIIGNGVQTIKFEVYTWGDAGSAYPDYYDMYWMHVDGVYLTDYDPNVASNTTNVKTEGIHNNTQVFANLSNPYFTWDYDDGNSDEQDAWEIHVGTTLGSSDRWNSTSQSGNDSGDNYAGSYLAKDTTYYVQVRTFDDQVWSDWETGEFLMPTGDMDYAVSVGGSQNTALQSINTSFGNAAPGTDFTNNTISTMYSLINSGNVNANVSALFTTNYSTTYGLVNGTEVIGGSNLKIGNSTLDALTDNGNPVTLTDEVPATNTTLNCGAQLRIPSSQPALDYSGIVELTFSDAT